MAAAILMEARLRGSSYGEKTALQLDTDQLINLIFSHFGELTHSGVYLEEAIETLQECGLAKSSNEPFSERFHRIEFSSLSKALAVAHKEGAEQIKAMEDMRLDDAELSNFPIFRAFIEHRLLERYHDFGDQWLRAQITKLMFDLANSDSNDNAANLDNFGKDSSRQSIRLTIEEGMRERILAEVAKTQTAVDRFDAGNIEKAQAKALLNAIQALAEAPEPPADLIWELLQRANNIAGIASLFIAIIALFAVAR